MRIAELLETENIGYDMEVHALARTAADLVRVLQARPSQVIQAVLVQGDGRPT